MSSLFDNLKTIAVRATRMGALVAATATLGTTSLTAQDSFVMPAAIPAGIGAGVVGTYDNVSLNVNVTDAVQCNWPNRQALDAVVAIAGEDGSYASGVVVDRNRVLTAAHALTLNHRVFVNVNEEYRPARILMVDRRDDLALLSVDTSEIAPLRVAIADPSVNQSVWAVGYPRATDKATTPGRLTRNKAGSLHASASIDLGQSGGGLLFCRDDGYYLGGMLRGYGAYERDGQFIKLRNHSVSVGATTIQRFFNSVPQGTTFSAAMVTN